MQSLKQKAFVVATALLLAKSAYAASGCVAGDTVEVTDCSALLEYGAHPDELQYACKETTYTCNDYGFYEGADYFSIEYDTDRCSYGGDLRINPQDITDLASCVAITAGGLSVKNATPTKGASHTPLDENIVLEFSENIELNSSNAGLVSLHNSEDNSTIQSFDLTNSSQANIQDTNLTLLKSVSLQTDSQYHLSIPQDLILSSADNSVAFKGFSKASDFSFTTNYLPMIDSVDDINLTKNAPSHTIELPKLGRDLDKDLVTATVETTSPEIATIELIKAQQIGADIYGEASGDQSGRSVAISSDGSIVAIGAFYNDGNGDNSGHVRIYENNGGTWTQIGEDIDGEATGDQSGNSIALSSDGTIVAIGAHYNSERKGHVRVYKYNSGTWTQIGADIDGEVKSDYSGTSVALSSDGTILAIGAQLNDGNGTNSGHVRIYKNSDINNNGTWTQMGLDIEGEAKHDYSGTSVSLSSDGKTVAIGAKSNGANGSDSGHVRVFGYDESGWTQIGSDIDGKAKYDNSGTSVSLSSDGTIVAIGAPNNSDNGINSGHVRIYENKSGVWTQIGSDIVGEAEYDNSGTSVSLSSDGTIVAIGAPINSDNGSLSGHVRIYENKGGVWSKIGVDIDGEAQNDNSGISIALSADGETVAIGAPYSDGNDYDEGQVRVYSTKSKLKITPKQDQEGRATISIKVDDGHDTNTETFTLIVGDPNKNPIITQGSDINVTMSEDSSPTAFSLTLNATDEEDDTITWSIETNATNGDASVSATPTGASQTINYTPNKDFNGQDSFTVQAADATGSSTITVNVTVEPVDDTPAITSTAKTDATQGGQYSYTLKAEDADGDTLNWSVKNPKPSLEWLSVTKGEVLESYLDGFEDIGGTAYDETTGDIYVVDGSLLTSLVSNKTSSTIYKIAADKTKTLFTQFDKNKDSVQMGSMVVHDGYLYVGTYNGATPTDGSLSRYDLSDTDGDVTAEVVKTGSYIGLSKKDGYLYGVKNSTDNTIIEKINFSDFNDATTYLDLGSNINLDLTGAPYGISFDKDANLIGTIYGNQNSVVYKYDGTNFSIVAQTSDNEDIYPTLTDVKLSSDGSLYLSYAPLFVDSPAGVYKYTYNTNTSKYEKVAELQTQAITWSMIVNSNNEIYFGSNSMDEEQNLISSLNTIDTNQYSLSGTPTNKDVGEHNITLELSDGTTTLEQSFTITVENVNDAPTSKDFSVTIDEDTPKTFSVDEFNFTDPDIAYGDKLESIIITSLVDKGVLTYNDTNVTLNQEINASNIANLVFTPSLDEFGSPYTTFDFKVNDGELDSTSSYTATINVNAVDDAPTLQEIADIGGIFEDADDFNITLVSSDVEGDEISYEVKSSNINVATVKIVDGKLVVSPVANASGVVNIEVVAVSNDKNATRSFSVEIDAVNDAPSIDTHFSDLEILEDAASFSGDMNISDVDGDDLNVTVVSDNESLLSVTPNFNEILTLGEYSGKTLDFNLTTLAYANGIANITVKVDDTELSDTKTFQVKVIAVNNAPTLSPISDIVTFVDTQELNVTLDYNDVDTQNLLFSHTLDGVEGLVKEIDIVANTMSIELGEGLSGETDVNLTLSDGDLNVSRAFKIKVLSLSKENEDFQSSGEIVYDENKTIVKFEDDNVTLQAANQKDENGAISHEVDLNGKTVKATSQIDGSTVQITENGVQTKYESSGANTIKAEVNATITGKASHLLEVDGIKVQAESEFVGAETIIKEDSNGDIEIETSLEVDTSTTVAVVAKKDGSAEHSVTKDNNTTKVVSRVAGAKTFIDASANVSTSVDTKKSTDNTRRFEAVAFTDANGQTVTKFRELIVATKTEENPKPTLKEGSSFPLGSEVEISEDSNVIHIQTTTPVLTKPTVFSIN